MLSLQQTKQHGFVVTQHGIYTCSHDLMHMCSVKLLNFIALLLFGTSDMHADIYVMTSADTDATAHSGIFMGFC